LDVQPIVWRVEHFIEIDSTNSWLADQARAGAPEGRAAYADYQSAGRGRLARTWEAPAGSALLCSVLMRPKLEPDDLSLVDAAVALSLRAAVVRLSGVRPDLKWPNDLLVEGRKLAGLLAELIVTDEGPAVVVGFGLNLTAHPEGATSLLEASGVRIEARALLDIVFEEIESRRALLDSLEGRRALHEEFERALVTLGQVVRVEQRDGSVVGVARRIDRTGRLIVDVDGEERTFSSGDVVHLRTATGPTS
jgi:BirA family transcriptional regulator, biotin operon repressor / biotin---[acetyl-CoA-carboxylase] ligase